MRAVALAYHQLSCWVKRVRRLALDVGRSGAVAIVTALCAPMLVMIIGFVVDYSYASYINQCLARATDAATLGSVSQTAATAGGGYGDLAFLRQMGVNYFNANTAPLGVTGINFSLSVTSDNAGGVTATGTYSYNVPTFFAGAVGISKIPVSGNAKTSARPLVYVNYYILVDTSQSMGIAATQADMDLLYNRVVAAGNWSKKDYPGCVFGCHLPAKRTNAAGVVSYQLVSNEFLAHNIAPRVNLRIDAAVSAIQGIINSAATVAATAQNIQFALYTIQLDPTNPDTTSNQISQVAPLSSNYASLALAAATIDLGNNVPGGFGDTDFPNELTAFNKILTTNKVLTNGSGASATSPLNYVFIVSDGLADTCANSHCTGPLNAANCTQLKAKATVGTIYTTYSTIWDANNQSAGVLDGDFSALVKRYVQPTSSVDQLGQALTSCATSSDYAFQANDGPDIVAAMQSLFQKTQASSARITR